VIKQFVATCGHVKPQKRVPDLGLGLLIRKEFIECQKGKIWLESGKGSGNVFCFLLPKESDYSNESTAD
jgi:signal transduction histidine kinase